MNRQAAEQAGPGTIVEGSAAVTSRANPFAALLPSVSPSTALRLAGLLIFPVLVAFGVDFRDAFHAMRTASPGFVIAALVVIQLTFIARAWRWQLFVEATGMRGVGFWSVYSMNYAGLFAGTVLPNGVASLTQTLFLAEGGHSWRRGLVSILADRLWEGFAALLLATVAAIYLWPSFPVMSATITAAGSASMLAFVLLLRFRRQLRGLSGRYGGRVPVVLQRAVQRLEPEILVDTLRGIRSHVPRLLVATSLAALGQMLAVVLLGMALDIDLSPILIAMAGSLIGLMMMLPITINGLGAREGILVLLFSAASAPREEAIALGLLMFAVNVLSRLPGFFAWARRPRTGPDAAQVLTEDLPEGAGPAPQRSGQPLG